MSLESTSDVVHVIEGRDIRFVEAIPALLMPWHAWCSIYRLVCFDLLHGIVGGTVHLLVIVGKVSRIAADRNI